MSAHWEDTAVRAAGLGVHLLGHRAIEDLAACRDVPALAEHLERSGRLPGLDARRGAAAVEAALRAACGQALHILALWCGEERTRALAVVFEEEDLRSLRALVRGAAAGAPAAERLAGLVPSPGLPAALLDELARLAGPAEVAAALERAGSPYAPAIAAIGEGLAPDLLRVEMGLARTFAERAVSGAREGDGPLRTCAAEAVDVLNAGAALALSLSTREGDPRASFLDGGRRITREAFGRAAEGGADAAAILAGALEPSPLATALRGPGGAAPAPAAVEGALLAARARAWTAAARGDPASSAPVLAYVLRLRAEARDVSAILWSLALGGIGAPGALPQARAS